MTPTEAEAIVRKVWECVEYVSPSKREHWYIDGNPK